MNTELPANILTLLPHSSTSQLINKQQKIDDLKLIKSIIEFSIKALDRFFLENLSAFDAQVGENLCQVRAYKILLLTKKWVSESEMVKAFIAGVELLRVYKLKLNGVIAAWETAIKNSNHFNKSLDGNENIIDFLKRHDLMLEINIDFIFIITCFFLTHFSIRKEGFPVAINRKCISQEFDISDYRSQRLALKYQQVVCKLGCDFIMDIANELPEEFEYNHILNSLCRVADEDRAVLPCYFVSEIIFYHSIQAKVPILLVVRRIQKSSNNITDVIHFLLESCENSQKKYFIRESQAHLKLNGLIVVGDMYYEEASVSTSINFIMEEDPLKVILANTASHPQYSGKKLSAYRNNPFEREAHNESVVVGKHINKLLQMKKFAEMVGCCKENKALFFLRHIYADRINDVINQLETQYVDMICEADSVLKVDLGDLYVAGANRI